VYRDCKQITNQTIIEAWPRLTAEVKADILAMIQMG